MNIDYSKANYKEKGLLDTLKLSILTVAVRSGKEKNRWAFLLLQAIP